MKCYLDLHLSDGVVLDRVNQGSLAREVFLASLVCLVKVECQALLE